MVDFDFIVNIRQTLRQIDGIVGKVCKFHENSKKKKDFLIFSRN